MRKLTGGVLHSKFWVVDGRHIYLGSANMDWRALTQVSVEPRGGGRPGARPLPAFPGAWPDVPAALGVTWVSHQPRANNRSLVRKSRNPPRYRSHTVERHLTPWKDVPVTLSREHADCKHRPFEEKQRTKHQSKNSGGEVSCVCCGTGTRRVTFLLSIF